MNFGRFMIVALLVGAAGARPTGIGVASLVFPRASRRWAGAWMAGVMLVAAAMSAPAGTLGNSYSVRGTANLEGTYSRTDAVEGDVVASEDSFSSLQVIGSGSRGDFGFYSMSARYGSLGVAIELSAHCYADGCGQHYLDTPLGNTSWFSEQLTLLNAPAAGYLAIDYRMEGTWQSEANGPGWSDQGMWLNLYVGSQNYSLGIHSAAANAFGQPDTSGTFYSANTLLVPYNSSIVHITMRMDAWARCDTGPNGDCRARMMFRNTGSVGGFRVLDEAGNPVAGATINSQSGHDYMAALDAESVPEPGGLVQLGIGLTLAITMRRRRHR